MFTWKSHAGLKFHFGQNERYEIHTVLSFISPQFKWTQVKSWLNTEVRFWTQMKSHTGLRSFCLSCARTLARTGNNKIKLFTRKIYQSPCQEEYSACATYRSCSVVYTCDSMRIRGLGRVILDLRQFMFMTNSCFLRKCCKTNCCYIFIGYFNEMQIS